MAVQLKFLLGTIKKSKQKQDDGDLLINMQEECPLQH